MAAGSSGRGLRRRFLLCQATLLGFARHAYLIPSRAAGFAAQPAEGAAYPALETRLRAAEPRFRHWLAVVDGHAAALEAIGAAAPPEPRWDQAWFPRLDAAIAYAMVRERRPRRLVEVGSGHSTRFFARAARDAELDCAIEAIDPQPRADLAGLAAVRQHRLPVQKADPAVFAALAAGDILSIDSSHVLMPGSDVDHLLNRILPALPSGVWLHVHDVLLPDDYPAEWGWRGYNEQLGVAALLSGGAWEVEFAAHYVAGRMASALTATVIGSLPLRPGALETSLWLRKS